MHKEPPYCLKNLNFKRCNSFKMLLLYTTKITFFLRNFVHKQTFVCWELRQLVLISHSSTFVYDVYVKWAANFDSQNVSSTDKSFALRVSLEEARCKLKLIEVNCQPNSTTRYRCRILTMKHCKNNKHNMKYCSLSSPLKL